MTKVSNVEPVKKNRRGVSNKTQAVSQLKFHEKDAAANGLFIGHLEDVRVEWSVNADGKMFTGLKMPRLVFEFCSQHATPAERRHVYQNLLPVESNVDTIPGGKDEWKVNNVLNWIKHLLDIYYLNGRELTEEEEDALTLPFEDFDDEGNYVAIEPQDVLDGYGVVFNNVVYMFNGSWNLPEGETAKPCYKTADGKFKPAWLKLLRHKKRKNEWINVANNGDLGFDTFIGSGAIELMKGNNPPAILRIDRSKESIVPQETNKTPNIPGAVPGMGAAPVVVGSEMSGAFTDAAVGEMPF